MIATIHRYAPALAALCALTLGTAPALACSCVPQTVEQAKQAAAAIFEGRVSSIADAPQGDAYALPEKIVTLEVARSWRGLGSEQTVTLRTAESGATCGYAFEQGASYLVYADGPPDKLQVNSCGRTRRVSEASEDFAALGEGVAPPKRESAPPAAKRGGCASAQASTSASAASLCWFGASGAGFFARRGRRRKMGS